MKCFKTYDVRGIYPNEFNAEIAREIAQALITDNIKTVAIGYDARKSSPVIAGALVEVFQQYDIYTLLIPECGTEEVYYEAVGHAFDLGIMVTASHNPKEYNGLKFILRGGVPFTAKMLQNLKNKVRKNKHPVIDPERKHSLARTDKKLFWSFLCDIAQFDQFNGPKHKIVVNCGNGTVGNVLKDKGFILINEKPDSDFPNGVPNPMLPTMREETSKAVIEHKADFGVAFDGDFDRCFFFDNEGKFIDGYYSGGVLTKIFLAKYMTGASIAYDTRLYWNTLDILRRCKGSGVSSKAGHVFMKETMRSYDCILGFEISGHHYFKEFGYCDSGILPLLFMDKIESPLAELVQGMQDRFPCSDEINFTIPKSFNPFKKDILTRVNNLYKDKACSINYMDGIGLEFHQWRFSLRQSNTEPLVRLNVESKGSRDLVEEKVAELSKAIMG